MQGRKPKCRGFNTVQGHYIAASALMAFLEDTWPRLAHGLGGVLRIVLGALRIWTDL